MPESYSRQETQKIAYQFAQSCNSGDVICLNGDLGAGKTAFVAGFVKAFGYTGYTSSPTFTLINEYLADVPIYHFDVYRMEDPGELDTLGIDEYLYGDGICLIEWADKIAEFLPAQRYEVTILKDDSQGEDYRNIEIVRRGETE